MQSIIQKIKDEKIEQKTKDELVHSYQQQIQELQQQIQQLRTDSQSSDEQNDSQSSSTTNSDGDSLSLSQDLEQKQYLYANQKIQNKIAGSLQGKAKIIKVEAKLDEDRDPYGNAREEISKKREKASNMEYRANHIGDKIPKEHKKSMNIHNADNNDKPDSIDGSEVK